MNNEEKANAALLKKAGFLVFWQYKGENDGEYWAIHEKLICQYHLRTAAADALSNLANGVLIRHVD